MEVVSDERGLILEREPDTLLGPDLAIVQSARVPADENSYPTLVPDPVRRAVRVRRANGIGRLLSEQDEFIGEDVLSGFGLPMAQLFA